MGLEAMASEPFASASTILPDVVGLVRFLR